MNPHAMTALAEAQMALDWNALTPPDHWVYLAILLVIAVRLFNRPGRKLPAGAERVTLMSVVDGDTVKALVPSHGGRQLSVRLAGIDAPETTAASAESRRVAILAKTRVRELVNRASAIGILNERPDKYGGRIGADLYVDGKNVAEVLLAEGLARPWDGEGVKPWPA